MSDPETAIRAAVAAGLAAIRAVEKLAAMHGFVFTPGAVMCECPVMPMNHWYRGATMALAFPLAAPDGTAERDPAADTAAYNGGGYDSWVIACPRCRRMFAAGTDCP